MKLGLFRHGEKQSEWIQDPLLSPQGELQARALKEAIEKGILPKPTRLLVSPKIRTAQTFSSAARFLSLAVEKMDDLDERTKSEELPAFKKRISKWVESVSSSRSDDAEDVIYVCSHLDWIEEFSYLVPCDTDLHQLPGFHWSPGAYLFFDIETLWHLTQKGQLL